MRVKRITPQPEVITEELTVDLDLINPLIEKYKGKAGNLIPLLQGTQEVFGFIPHDAFMKISNETGIPVTDLYGVATFYAQFRLVPSGKYIIKMCHGTACHVQSVTAVTNQLLDFLEIKDGETTTDRLFTLETVACLGCCSLAPVMMINEDTYGKLSPAQGLKIVKEIKRGN